MRLSGKIIIEKDKIVRYLLLKHEENDKSKFLKASGYSLLLWKKLEEDIKIAAHKNKAKKVGLNPYGTVYKMCANWFSPNGKEIYVIIIWIKLKDTDTIKFVTLYPDKEALK